MASFSPLNRMDRRGFIKTAAAGVASSAIALNAAGTNAVGATKKSAIELPALPFAPNALAPYLSEKTVNTHYNDHHRAYVTSLNNRIADTPYVGMPLEKIIDKTNGVADPMTQAIFYTAVLVYNHNQYWPSLTPGGGSKMPSRLKTKIEQSFGSVAKFRDEFKRQSAEIGVGWVWLLSTNDTLIVRRTTYHQSPIVDNQKPLLALDVWEHAYYLDYLNNREKYVDAFLDHLANWESAQARLSS